MYIFIVYFTLWSTFAIFLTLLSDFPPLSLPLYLIIIPIQGLSTEFPTVTQYISRNIRKRKVWPMWCSCCIVTTFSFFSFYRVAQLLFQSFITIVWFDFNNIHSCLYFLDEFFKYFNLHGKLPYPYWIFCRYAILLSLFWDHLVMYQWIKAYNLCWIF